MHDSAPPRLPLALLGLLLSRSERGEVLADVREEHAARLARDGPAAARRWLWRQALGSAPALLGWSWWREWSGFEPPANAYNPGGAMLRSWITDAQYAARRLRARPGYVLLAALTLGLGVGGTSAVFGITRGLLFDPLPYPHEREVGVFWKKSDWSEEEFQYVRGRFPGFRDVARYRHVNLRLQQEDAPMRLLPGITASAELFDVLGTQPLLGRAFRAGDDVTGAEPVIVLSYGLWQELGADPGILETSLALEGRSHRVIGVMPRGFWFPDPTVGLWTPLPPNENPTIFNSTLVGRVAAGQDLRALQQPVAQLTTMLDERFNYPPQFDKAVDARVTPIREDLFGRMRPALLATLASMALILLIACANVAALMIGQVHARTGELATRFALGANRRRLTQQLVIEAMLIAVVAGALGTALAWSGFRLLARALPLGPWTGVSTPDWTVFATGMVIAFAASLLVVLIPTLSLWRGELRGALSSARTGGLQGRGGRMEGGLVVAEVALAVLIASGAALLGRSVTKLYALDPGLQPESVGVVDVMLPGGFTRQRQRLEELTGALAALPGVRSAGAVQTLPLGGGGYRTTLVVEGRTDLDGVYTEYRIVTPGYLETLGFQLLAGRTITPGDRGDGERVVVINQAFAETYFPNTDPLGRLVGGDADAAAVVVGVVANAAERLLTDAAVPVRYVAAAQMGWLEQPQSLVLKADAGVDPLALLEDARRAVQSAAPDVAVRRTTTLSRVLAESVGPARQVMSLLSLLSGLALTLGAVGVYGVIAHFAARRRREWALRVALGLPASGAVTHVFRRGARLVVFGIALGVGVAAGLAGLLSPLLYEVRALDPIAFAGAAAALLAVGLFAAFVPARRAGVIDPAIVLREP
jgi:predicted permease